MTEDDTDPAGPSLEAAIEAALRSEADTKPSIIVPPAPPSFLEVVLLVAREQLGVHESGSPNRGPEVDEYISRVGLHPERASYPWCAAFVYWCFDEAALRQGVENPCPRTASALQLVVQAPMSARVKDHHVRPGCIVVWNHGAGKGHCGIVESVDFLAAKIGTIEGNSDDAGGREGVKVCRHVRSMIEPALFGFVDLGGHHGKP